MFYFPRARLFAPPFGIRSWFRVALLVAIVAYIVFSFIAFAHAQDAATTSVTVTPAGAVNPGNVISLAPLISILLQAFGVLIVGIVTFYTPMICKAIAKALHVNIDQAMIAQATSVAATAAGGIFANATNMATVKNASFTVNSKEVADAANAALAKIPAAQARLGLTSDHMKDLVLGELGKLQAAGTPPADPVGAAPAAAT